MAGKARRSPSPAKHRLSRDSSSSGSENDYLHPSRQYHQKQQRRPLIERINNAWQHEKHAHADGSSSEDGYDSDSSDCIDYCNLESSDPRRFFRRVYRRTKWTRRILALSLLILWASVAIFKSKYLPFIEEDRSLRVGLDKKFGAYGVQLPSKLKEISQVARLDSRHLPGGSEDATGIKRLIFIGDIHGCVNELKALLVAVKYDKLNDHIVHTGDVVAKGPDSAGVIDTLIELNASGVRGNWEDRVLTASRPLLDQTKPRKWQDDLIDKKSSKESAVLTELKQRHLDYLHSLPLILTIPRVTPPSHSAPSLDTSTSPLTLRYDPTTEPSTIFSSSKSTTPSRRSISPPLRYPINVVHAGIVPAVPLSRHDPSDVMNMRAIHPITHLPSPKLLNGTIPWPRLWAWYQERLVRGIRRPDVSVIGAQIDGSHERTVGSFTFVWRHRPYGPEGFWAGMGRIWAEYLGAMGWGSIVSGREVEGWSLDGAKEGEKYAAWAQERVDKFRELKDEEEKVNVLGHGEKPSVVVYGHDSKAGVRVEKWSVGLDGGCVKGGRLTALTLDAWGQREVVSVPCEGHVW